MRENQKDPFEVLGISRGSSDAEIKSAFRRLALQYHPDRNKSFDAEERFKDIHDAFERLEASSDQKIDDKELEREDEIFEEKQRRRKQEEKDWAEISEEDWENADKILEEKQRRRDKIEKERQKNWQELSPRAEGGRWQTPEDAEHLQQEDVKRQGQGESFPPPPAAPQVVKTGIFRRVVRYLKHRGRI